jgi:3-oxoacyl-[acyl-carrier protein] reductase
MEENQTKLKGKVALVTGASKGIGRAVALRLAADGVYLALGATGAQGLEALQPELEDLGASALVKVCDVGRRADCEDLVQYTLEKFGKIDILINNAGIGYSGTVVESEPGEVERMVRTNVLGVYYMTRAVLPAMVKRQSGDIVNIGSVAGTKYSPQFAMYSATKFAVRALTEGLRNEVQAHNIRVTLVNPGMVDTHFFNAFTRGGVTVAAKPADLLRPDDIAAAIHFALSRPAGVAMNDVTVRPSWQER